MVKLKVPSFVHTLAQSSKKCLSYKAKKLLTAIIIVLIVLRLSISHHYNLGLPTKETVRKPAQLFVYKFVM